MSRRIVLRVIALAGAALLLGACAGLSTGLPRVVADAEPIPGGCPPSICPQHTPSQPPPPDDEPEPTPTPSKSSKPKPAPSKTSAGAPGTPASPSPGATTAALVPAPAQGKTRFAAFPFGSLPFDQAFPLDAPPPPAPLAVPPATAMVALAATLAAGVAAATSIVTRRRAWPAVRPAPTGGTA